MPDKQSRGASGSVGKPRPRIHNKKLLAAIHAAVIEHSGNGELANHVVEHISAESVIGGNDDQSTPQVPPNPDPAVSAPVRQEEGERLAAGIEGFLQQRSLDTTYGYGLLFKQAAASLRDKTKLVDNGSKLGVEQELLALIGQPPEGSEADEWKPRADTWHQERLNWINEVDRLRTHIAGQIDRINLLMELMPTEQTLGEPDASSGSVNSPRQITPALLSEIAAALTWLDEFVEVPETFPGEGDYQWWHERRTGIRELARRLPK